MCVTIYISKLFFPTLCSLPCSLSFFLFLSFYLPRSLSVCLFASVCLSLSFCLSLLRFLLIACFISRHFSGVLLPSFHFWSPAFVFMTEAVAGHSIYLSMFFVFCCCCFFFFFCFFIPICHTYLIFSFQKK